jgi:hypothetical protein
MTIAQAIAKDFVLLETIEGGVQMNFCPRPNIKSSSIQLPNLLLGRWREYFCQLWVFAMWPLHNPALTPSADVLKHRKQK